MNPSLQPNTTTHEESLGTSERGTAQASRKTEVAGAWMVIPISWMERCRLDVSTGKLHQLLKLDTAEADQLMQATRQMMESAQREQAAEVEGRVMKEDDTIHLPALSDAAIHAHVEEVVSVLPDNLSAAEKDLVRFLVKRRLKEEYGENLEVTLAFTGGLSISDLRHASRHLLGFHYVVRPTGSQEEASGRNYNVEGHPRLDFLKLDPSVNNEGRNPRDR